MKNPSEETPAGPAAGTDPGEVADAAEGWESRRAKIIGLGEQSARKSYYPELQQRLDALHESERRFRLMAENIQDGLTIIEGGTVTFVNERACAIFGYPPAEYASLSLLELAAPEEREWLRRHLLQLETRKEHPQTLSFWIARKDGTRRYVQNRHSYYGQGERVTCYRVTTDLTEQKQRQREQEAIAALATALREAGTRPAMGAIILAQCRSLLGATGAALLAPNGDGDGLVVEQASGRWRLLAADTDAQRGPCPCMKTGRVFANHSLEGARCGLYPAAPEKLEGWLCAPLKAQEVIFGVLMVGRDRDFDEAEKRVMVALTDIAANALHRAALMETLEQRVQQRTLALQEANARLKDLDRLKNKFVSNVSHELRTPVTNIRLYLDLLVQQPDPARRERYVQVLNKESQRLVQLIEDILVLSRLERAVEPFSQEPHVLDVLVAEVFGAFQAQADAQALALRLDPEPDVPPVPLHYQHMTQVITNLVANAVAYARPGSTITARTARRRREGRPGVDFTVHNGGVPIPESDLPHVFERFYRGTNAQEAAGAAGTGLGLAICREIVERHQGTIALASSREAGTTVTVWLPL